MARRFRLGKPSKRETALRRNAAFQFYGMPQRVAVPDAPKKRRRRSADGKPLEKHVLKAIIQALRLHPKVSRVERNQSGVFQEGNRFIRVGSRGKLDLTVYLKDGRYMEIEVKRPGGRVTSAQRDRIYTIQFQGGLAGWADSVEGALALLP